MIAIRSQTSGAGSLDAHARIFVDRINRDHYDGHMPLDIARQVYRTAVAAQAHRWMLEELEPINRALARFAFMSLEPTTVPPDVEAFRLSIITRWQAAVTELLQ